MTQRKGARRISEVSPEVKAALEAGTLPTANLTEWLAVDLRKLLEAVLPQIGLKEHLRSMSVQLEERSKDGVLKRMTWIGAKIAEILSCHAQGERIFELLATHSSDIARCFAAFVVGSYSSLEHQLEAISPLAADPHFGVRECAWMAVRPLLAKNVAPGIALLHPWAKNSDDRVRRFAIEITRPRGVWCAHLPELKQHPERGLPLLELVRADKEKYVQDSVSNWLNDASKSQPDWVRKVCARWLQESSLPETERIVRRALRSIEKS